MCVQNLKSVAFPVPEIGGIRKIGQSLDTPTLPFLQNFSWALIRIDPAIVLAKFEVRSLTRSSEIIAIEFLGGVANPQSWRRGSRIGGRGWYHSTERWRVPIGPP